MVGIPFILSIMKMKVEQQSNKEITELLQE